MTGRLPMATRIKQVVRLRCHGKSVAEIANELGLSANTTADYARRDHKVFGQKPIQQICFEIGREIGRKEGK